MALARHRLENEAVSGTDSAVGQRRPGVGRNETLSEGLGTPPIHWNQNGVFEMPVILQTNG